MKSYLVLLVLVALLAVSHAADAKADAPAETATPVEAGAPADSGERELEEVTGGVECTCTFKNGEKKETPPKGPTGEARIPTAAAPLSHCYEHCQESSCAGVFASGWEKWYHCIQSCIKHCYAIRV